VSENLGTANSGGSEISSSPAPSRRTTLMVVVSAIAALFLALRAFREVVPIGASPIPCLFARVEGGELRDPSGAHRFRVTFNDAGATHSGNHWCWISSYSVLSGWRVIAEGYVGREVAVKGKPLEVRWIGPGRFRVSFLEGRDSSESVWRDASP
jgi:hypothetical protein